MARCRHNKNVIITEASMHTAEHHFENGCVMHNLNYGDYTSAVAVYCNDCGFDKIYYRSALPKWVENAIYFMATYQDLDQTGYNEIPNNYER